jgi:cellulose synthase/poly-beta-1,6-N-acetylglucosamine synthase-like glycosyltransferase
MKKLTVIINCWDEPSSIGRAIKCIADQEYSGIPTNFELIQVTPDEITLDAGQKVADELKLGNKYIQVRDPLKGKPYALNMALQHATGDIVIMTDGDVYFGKGSVAALLEPFENEEIGGVTGCEYSQDDKSTMMKYFGHLLASAADHNRRLLTQDVPNRTYRISKENIVPMSGRCYATRNFHIEIPASALAEDGYMSAQIMLKGYKSAYQPAATAFAKYPLTVKDFIKQKARSLGGFPQLERLGIKTGSKSARKFTDELKYAWFPIKYATNPQEFWWSLMLYPIRLWTWYKIKINMTKMENRMGKVGWERIQSTKEVKDRRS